MCLFSPFHAQGTATHHLLGRTNPFTLCTWHSSPFLGSRPSELLMVRLMAPRRPAPKCLGSVCHVRVLVWEAQTQEKIVDWLVVSKSIVRRNKCPGWKVGPVMLASSSWFDAPWSPKRSSLKGHVTSSTWELCSNHGRITHFGLPTFSVGFPKLEARPG